MKQLTRLKILIETPGIRMAVAQKVYVSIPPLSSHPFFPSFLSCSSYFVLHSICCVGDDAHGLRYPGQPHRCWGSSSVCCFFLRAQTMNSSRDINSVFLCRFRQQKKPKWYLRGETYHDRVGVMELVIKLITTWRRNVHTGSEECVRCHSYCET